MNSIKDLAFFQSLADYMNDHPDTFEILGEVDMTMGIIMFDPAGEDLRVCLPFEELGCASPTTMAAGQETGCDCWLEGDLAAWEPMFKNIEAGDGATGRQTISSLTLVGEHIEVHGIDPMGIDRFFRFNQTVQQFFDGAGQLALSNS